MKLWEHSAHIETIHGWPTHANVHAYTLNFLPYAQAKSSATQLAMHK
jgi:hypothetical protein